MDDILTLPIGDLGVIPFLLLALFCFGLFYFIVRTLGGK